MAVSVYFVRHGKAAAAWGTDPDPGLDDTGTAQARTMAAELGQVGPLRLLTSPKRRARETAAALEMVWGAPAKLEPRATEVAARLDQDPAERRVWLDSLMAGKWSDPGAEELAEWRENLIAAVAGMTEDTVVASHFVAINVLAGHAMNDDRVIVFRPDHCSVTRFSVADGKISLTELGREVVTEVL